MKITLLALFGTMIPVAVAAAPTTGAQLFEQNCAACHQAAGQGIPGAFPALSRNALVNGDQKKLAQTILAGRGGMPSFRDSLDDAQIAAILSFVRSSWGNKAAPITPATVATIRGGATGPLARPIPAH